MAQTIKDYIGKTCYLSEEKYILTESAIPTSYKKGTMVRKISGVDNSNIIGYHFSPGWVTVCKVGVRIAEFIGVEEKYLKRI